MGWLVNTLRYFCRPLVVFLTPVFLSSISTIYTTKEAKWASVFLTMVIYWISEALPSPVTSLIPIFAFPLLGISSTNEVCSSYMNEANALLIGSILVSLAVQQSRLDKRIALKFILTFGQTDRSIMISTMAITCFLSMWLNTIVGSSIMLSLVMTIAERLENERCVYPKIIIPKITITNFEKAKEVKNEDEIIQIEESPKYWEDSNDRQISSEFQYDLNNEEKLKISREKFKSFLYLGIIFASNVGGIIVNIGSPANMLCTGFVNSFWSDNKLTFLSWIGFNSPIAIFCIVLGYIYIQYSCFGFRINPKYKERTEESQLWTSKIGSEYRALGRVSGREAIVGSLFIFLIFLWTFRDPGFIPGWENYFKDLYDIQQFAIYSATPALMIATLLFSIPQTLPSDLNSQKGSRHTESIGCLTWDYVKDQIPWSIVLIMGSGFALADAAAKTDIHLLIDNHIPSMKELPMEVIVLILTSMTVFITTLSSNSVSAAIILPIVKEIIIGLNINPLQVMLPVATCCSFTFLKPVILDHSLKNKSFTHALAKQKDIIKGGLILNVICLITVNVLTNTIGNSLFNFDSFYDATANHTDILNTTTFYN